MSSSEGGNKLFYVLSEIVVLMFLASPCLLLIVRLCLRDCGDQEARQRVETFGNPEKRKNDDVLTALVTHQITRHDLHLMDKENEKGSSDSSDSSGAVKMNSTDDVEAQISETIDESKVENIRHIGKSVCRRLSFQFYSECMVDSLDTYPNTSRAVVKQEDSFFFESIVDERLSDCFKTCAICLADYEEGDSVCWGKISSCSHVFHQHCLLPWLSFHDTCPVCRSNLFVISNV